MKDFRKSFGLIGSDVRFLDENGNSAHIGRPESKQMAFELSLAAWWVRYIVAKNTNPEERFFEPGGMSNCGLCMYCNFCYSCPVYEETGHILCDDTPYEMLNDKYKEFKLMNPEDFLNEYVFLLNLARKNGCDVDDWREE